MNQKPRTALEFFLSDTYRHVYRTLAIGFWKLRRLFQVESREAAENLEKDVCKKAEARGARRGCSKWWF